MFGRLTIIVSPFMPPSPPNASPLRPSNPYHTSIITRPPPPPHTHKTTHTVDGCSIFWRTRRFRLARAEEVEYLVPGTRHLDRDNVGVIAVLEDLLWGGGGGEGKGKVGGRPRRLLVVANTHLLFNPRRGDVKLAQVQMLLRRLEVGAMKGRGIVCVPVPGYYVTTRIEPTFLHILLSPPHPHPLTH